MARIAGVNLPLNKRTEIGLTYVHGIGDSTSRKILAETGVDGDTRVGDLTEDEVIKLFATPSTSTRSRATSVVSAPRTSSA